MLKEEAREVARRREIEARDVANVFPDAYTGSAHIVLPETHKYLFQRVEEFLLGLSKKKNLLVVGAGSQFLPFSRSKERVRAMMDDGSIILMDYAFNAEKVVGSVEGLTKLGFFDEGCFRPGEVTDESIDPKDLGPRTIKYHRGNLRENLKYPDESLDCIDATIVIHHATPYGEDLDRIIKEIHRVLKKDGMFHFGTGDVDMKYSERKIRKIARHVATLLKTQILVSDIRDEKYPVTKDFSGQFRHEGPIGTTIRIGREGMVYIPTKNPEKMARHLSSLGYKQIKIETDGASIPLIDPETEEDKEGLIAPVDRFYDAIQARADHGLQTGQLDRELFEKVCKAVVDERGKARKGIVEYYTGEARILEGLENAGFRIETIKHYKTEPFYNIVAFK